MGGTKIFTPCPQKLGYLAQKRPKLVQNLHFWLFWAKYCHFLHILSNARPKNNAHKVPRWVFHYVSNKTFDFSSKKRIFCPETTEFGLSDHCWLIRCPVDGLAGGCGAQAVSRKTPIYFIKINTHLVDRNHNKNESIIDLQGTTG